jgi:hypothetical protein
MNIYKTKLSPDQIPDGMITLRMLAAQNIFTALASDQKGRIELTAGVKLQIDFHPAFLRKPLFKVWGCKPGDESTERGINLHELTKDSFTISCDADAVASFQASALAAEYITGTVVE